MLAFYLTKQLDLLAIDIVGKGSLSQVEVSFSDVFSRGHLIGAGAFILVHNHPSGDPRPSQADIKFTYRLKRISHDLDMPLLDHFVVAGSRMERVGIGISESSAEFKKRMEDGSAGAK